MQTEYPEAEWVESVGRRPVSGVDPEHIALLHRHWLWAQHARRWFEREHETGEPMTLNSLQTEGPFAMFLWYAMLYVVIEGFDERHIELRGRFGDDCDRIRDPLRRGRNAVFHVSPKYPGPRAAMRGS